MKRALTALVAVLLVVPMGWRLSGPKAPRFPYGVGPARSVVPAGFTEWSVEVEPGVKLRAVRRAPNGPDASWMLLIHGNDAAQLETGAALLSRLEADPAVGLATYAFRGFDGSPGTPSRDALYADAAAVVKALGVAPQRLHLVAYSLGGPLALRVAADLSRAGTPPASLTLLAGASEIAMVHPVPWAKLTRGDVFIVGDELDAVKCPVRLFHGTADEALPVEQARAMAARLGARGTLVELPGVTHAEILTATLPR